MSPAVLVGTVAVAAFGGPTIALVFGTLSSNTIEGVALSKLVNLVILGPAVVVAVVSEPYQFAAGVLPSFWPVKAFVAGVAGQSAWLPYLIFGLVVHVVALTTLGRLFTRETE